LTKNGGLSDSKVIDHGGIISSHN